MGPYKSALIAALSFLLRGAAVGERHSTRFLLRRSPTAAPRSRKEGEGALQYTFFTAARPIAASAARRCNCRYSHKYAAIEAFLYLPLNLILSFS